jgi:hypothetical protein
MVRHRARWNKTCYYSHYISRRRLSDDSDGPAQGDDLEQHPQVAHERHERVLPMQTEETTNEDDKDEVSEV